MVRLWGSVAFRLALACGILVVVSITVFATFFYFGTVGVLDKEVDRKIDLISQRLASHFETKGLDGLQREIQDALNDRVDSDTEIYLLVSPDGRKIEGNLPTWTESTTPLDQVIDRKVIREGRPSVARLLLHKLPNGALLIIGRDMKDVNEIAQLVWHTIGVGIAVALGFAIGGTILFRRLLERRVGTIRRTAEEIEAGNLSRRIPVSGVEDEFARLGADINRMLDRIEQLMDGVRHVSNTIAHNLRTPLGRIRGHLDEALRSEGEAANLADTASFAIEEIDALVIVLAKLLQIAETESGIRRQPFEPVALREVVTNVTELYDAVAENQGIALATKIDGDPKALGDKSLLESALANLLDNALKYGGRSVMIEVHASPQAETVTLIVRDEGPGIPLEERHKVIQRFYRLNHSVAGSGLGLSIVAAIAHLHGATLHLEDAAPGLLIRIVFPVIDSGTFPNVNPTEMTRKGDYL
jgi:signal transduction histidine kinase